MALVPQPASVRFREFPSQPLEMPANCGLFAMAKISELPLVELLAAIFPKVSTQHQENSRFLETRRRDRRIKLCGVGLPVLKTPLFRRARL